MLHTFDRQILIHSSTLLSTRRCASTSSSATLHGNRARRPKVKFQSFIYPILLASAVTSLAIHLRNAREDIRLLHSRHDAQLSVLKSLVARLERGETIEAVEQKNEFQRVGLIDREFAVSRRPKVGWKEMLFGRKKGESELAREKQEMQDIEEGEFRSAFSLLQFIIVLICISLAFEYADKGRNESTLSRAKDATGLAQQAQTVASAATASAASHPPTPARFESAKPAQSAGKQQANPQEQILI